MTYDEVQAALKGAAIFGVNPSLEGVTELVDELGRPQDSFASVQITGTNGKTSTSRITAALLRAEGFRVGLYTSPELQRNPDRIEIDGAVVSDADFALAIEAAVRAAERLRGEGVIGTAAGFTQFELLTAGALWLFRERSVDFAVLEVGMGGRWDATSVASPSVAVITGVGLDHTAILGDTLEAIAAEKAAIIRPASSPVLGPGVVGLDAIFLERAESVDTHARAVRAVGEPTPVSETLTVRYRLAARPDRPGGSVVVDVTGVHGAYGALALRGASYQAANIAVAVGAAEAALGRALSADRAREALGRLAIPGRFELVRENPPIVVDGSHNPQAASVLADAVREAFPDARPAVLLGILADKDAEGIVRALAPVASRIVVTQSRSPRAMSADALAELVERVTGEAPEGVFSSVAQALAALISLTPEGLLVTGSITTAGEARGLLLDDSTTLSR
ncbi:MAG: bifunctional folylpolyglutamate synthase/dihydrofolate synthase [Coriobacteriia bacterium]|nr:bifunctional folylpolyglutamate synthase/dihydrofolate synthase [Coriobacteriia bacterium]